MNVRITSNESDLLDEPSDFVDAAEEWEEGREDLLDQKLHEHESNKSEHNLGCKARQVEDRSCPEQASETPLPDLPTPLHAKSALDRDEKSYPEYPLHRAAFHDDVDALKSLLRSCSREQLLQLDPQGNTVLHVAVTRQHSRCVEALLEGGFPVTVRNARGWMPIFCAVELRNHSMAMSLARAEFSSLKSEVKQKRRGLLDKLQDLPDFSMQLNWELNSSVPGVGLLLRRYAPHDTYTIWKQGSRIRVDGSLMGMKEPGASLLPDWKRGHFSLVYDGTGGASRITFLNHTKKKWVDVKAMRKRMAPSMEEMSLEMDVESLFAKDVILSRKMKAAEMRFKPVSGWLSKELTEKVEGWETKVYEASGRVVAATKYKMPTLIPAGCTWEQYVAMQYEQDIVVEAPVNPLSMSMFSDKDHAKEGTGTGGHDAATQRKEVEPVRPELAAPTCSSQPPDGTPLPSGYKAESAPTALGSEATASTSACDLRAYPTPGSQFGEALSEVGSPLKEREADSTAHAAESPEVVGSSSQGEWQGGKEGEEEAGTACTSPPSPAPPAASPLSSNTLTERTKAAAAVAATVADAAAKNPKNFRKLSGRCWMASAFPLSLHQLMPLLDVIGTANKHIGKVGKFMSKYGDKNMFPVKVQVPIILTVYIMLQFKKFKLAPPASAPGSAAPAKGTGSKVKRLLGMGSKSASGEGVYHEPLPPDFFVIPPDYKESEPKEFFDPEQFKKKQKGYTHTSSMDGILGEEDEIHFD